MCIDICVYVYVNVFRYMCMSIVIYIYVCISAGRLAGRIQTNEWKIDRSAPTASLDRPKTALGSSAKGVSKNQGP